jgi:aminopeptidase N
MTFQISRRGKEYLETAQTLLRAAQTMADRAIAGQLKALAEDYQRRAEKALRVDAAKAFAQSAANAEASDRHDLMDSFAARRAEEMFEME